MGLKLDSAGNGYGENEEYDLAISWEKTVFDKLKEIDKRLENIENYLRGYK